MSTENIEHVVNRNGWGSGPWDGEPDREEWRHLGFPCLIARNPYGALCGYVGLPPGHPLHGKSYGDDAVDELSVHGGITYGNACAGHICHVPGEGEPGEVWWLGFDCNHTSDYAPGGGLDALGIASIWRGMFDPGVEFVPSVGYKPIAYVRAEVEQLAAQLAEFR